MTADQGCLRNRPVGEGREGHKTRVRFIALTLLPHTSLMLKLREEFSKRSGFIVKFSAMAMTPLLQM